MVAKHRAFLSGVRQSEAESSCNSHRNYHKGQIIFNGRDDQVRKDQTQAFQVTSGEVVIIRNGILVDIVEAGEILDPSIWRQAVGIAWKNCRLVKMN